MDDELTSLFTGSPSQKMRVKSATSLYELGSVPMEERSRGYVVVEQGCEGSDSEKEGCA